LSSAGAYSCAALRNCFTEMPFRRRNLDRFDGKASTDEFVLQAAKILEREVCEEKGR
jgi:hypothetical protein